MQDKLPAIQYLRAIAAMAVAVEHAAIMTSFDKYYGQEVPYFDFWHKGALGVNLFFVISGFIIMVSSLHKRSLTPKKRVGEFFVARFIRIIPMMWIAVISYASLRLLGRGTDYDIQPYVNAFFLLPFGEYDPRNIWTLRHEMIFYAVFAMAFMGLPRWRNGILLAWVLIAALPPLQYGNETVRETFNNIFAPVNILFGTGALIGMIFLRFPNHIIKLGDRLGEAFRSWHFLAICFMATMAVGSWRAYGTSDIRSAWQTAAMYGPLVFIGALRLSRANATMLYLGNASYSIYLFNPHLESALLGVMAKTMPAMPAELVVLTVSVGSVIGACFIHSFIEIPLTKTIHARTRFLFSKKQEN
jgi:exopolysaccharide production protein ExoZ